MATKAKRHVHKYHKVDIGYSLVWACALPDCNHYMPHHMEKTVLGKNSFCWACGEKFVLDVDALKSEKPTCVSCRLGTAPTVEETPMTEILQKYLEKLNV